jgi:hypothetical protein
MKNLANKIADQINLVEENEIKAIIVKAAEENNVDFNELYVEAGRAYYEKYERNNSAQVSDQYRENSLR